MTKRVLTVFYQLIAMGYHFIIYRHSVWIDVTDMMKTQLRSSAPITTESGTSSSASLANLEKIGIRLLCGPPGKPHIFKATGTSVSLQRSKPEYQGFHPIQYYFVHCQLQWRIQGGCSGCSSTPLRLRNSINLICLSQYL